MNDPTPPTASAAQFLGWAVAGLLAVAGTLWRALQTARDRELANLREGHAAELAGLRAQLDEARRREGERRDERDRLGRLLDDERDARARDAQRMALAIARRAAPEEAPRLAETWQEAPTGVHSRLDLVAQAVAPPKLTEAGERVLRRYSAGDPLSTPPEVPPRPRSPSRPR